MTAQIAEMLHYQGQDMAMCTTPLSDYFAMGGTRPRFASRSTALWRGYVGSWEVAGQRLYLVDLKGMLENGSTASLASVFPGFPERVFAHWYSGTIRLPQGKQLEYVHMGYASRFERDLLLDVARGVVVATRVQHNGTVVSPDAPEGYRIGAMTVLSPTRKGNGEAA